MVNYLYVKYFNKLGVLVIILSILQRDKRPYMEVILIYIVFV